MSQISPPIRIVLVLAVAVMAMYMLFLRPKPEDVPPAEPPAAPNVQTNEPAVSQPGKVAESAQGAVRAANGQLAQQEGVDGVDAEESAAGSTAAGTETEKPSTSPGKGATAKVDAELKGLPKPVRSALTHDKVLVLLFWNGKSADDKAVATAMKKVDRWDGQVSVQRASIKKISQYGRIARGVDVEQSPTIVVADPDLKADTLVGYVDSTTIDQAVVDAIRDSGRHQLFTDRYLRALDESCVRAGNIRASIPYYYPLGNVHRLDVRLKAVNRTTAAFAADFAAIKAPKKWRAFRKAAVADINAISANIARYDRAVGPKTSFAGALAAEKAYNAATVPITKRMAPRFDGKGLYRCGSQF